VNKSPNHTLSLHRLTSDSSVTSHGYLLPITELLDCTARLGIRLYYNQFAWTQCIENTLPLLLRACLLGFPRDGYLASPLARWLLPSDGPHRKHSYCCVVGHVCVAGMCLQLRCLAMLSANPSQYNINII
jgi:hypothetical protein